MRFPCVLPASATPQSSRTQPSFLNPILSLRLVQKLGGCQTVKRDGLLYEVNKETPFTGKTVRKHENGQMAGEATFEDGKPEGKMTAWYENGQMAGEATFKDGQPEGKMTTWYENGQMRSETTYKDGKEIAKKEWDEDGNPK